MEQKHSINSKITIKNIYIIMLTSLVIGIIFYGCKKKEPQQQENSPAASVSLEQQTPAEQAQSEPAEEIKAENIIEMAKWAEGKACATTIATALRAYAAENGTNGDYKNITVQKLFDTPYDLMGKYFNINNYELSDVSFDATRTEQPLHYTITVTRPDDSWKIKSFKLLHTGQWIQSP